MPTEELIIRPEQFAACCEHIVTCPVFGFDTEFIGEETFVPELCLLQVATPDRLFVIDPFSAGSLEPFWKLVTDPAQTAVVHAGREEIRLCHRQSGALPGNLFDLQIAAGLVGYTYPIGHGTLIQQALSVHLHKHETLTNWRQRPLSPQQLEYAFDDVRYLLQLWEKLSAKLAKLGRNDWPREETDLLLQRSLGQDPSVERWRKLKGAGALDRKRLAVLRALYTWREEKATQRNRPVRTVVRDDLLVEIARRNPKQEADLELMRGLSKRDVPEIKALLDQVRTRPAEELPALTPRDDDPPEMAWIVSVLHAVLCDWCQKNDLSPALAASNHELKTLIRSLARNEPLPAASPLAKGWRKQALLPELLPLLQGKRGLRIKSLEGQTPFEVRDL
ncbi:MAG TPA: HRDC domain-containing protein [Gemmataceae bacterium]|jgi:ribonuclease D|nr:HRDC domain-containing protein [Gemmataceae bacterium]